LTLSTKKPLGRYAVLHKIVRGVLLPLLLNADIAKTRIFKSRSSPLIAAWGRAIPLIDGYN
jgi:hypothetical protein